MRLFLSSYRAGVHEDALKGLLGPVKRMAYISNAKDYKSASDRQAKVEENFAYWRSIGLEPTEIDLRPYFNKTGAEKTLEGFEFVWLAGGNAFLLRRALSYTGLDDYLRKKVRDNSIIYGGESAGAIMTGPTLEGSEDDSTNEDDPNYVPKPYEKTVMWDGLGLTDFIVVPHYQSPEIAESIEGYIGYIEKKKWTYEKITDDQAIIVDGNKVELLK